MGSVGFAGILGALFLSSGGTGPAPSATVATVVGSQHVPVETKEEPHRVIRIRAPIRDFLGLNPPDDSGDDGGDSKKATCCPCQLPKEKPAKSKPEEAWNVDPELEKQLDKYKLNFLIMTVADPIDAVENYFFDHQIDALLKALSADQTDQWLYCSSYLPWQVFKDRRTVENKTPLLRQKHWYQDEPGVLVFRKSQAAYEKTPELLLVYLVGELPTFGIQRDAMDHAIHEIAMLTQLGQPENTRDCRREFAQAWIRKLYGPADGEMPRTQSCLDQPRTDVRIIGPYFTGGAFSLRESLREATPKYFVRPQIITAGATAIDDDYFDEEQFIDFIGATVCSWKDTYKAINDNVINKRKCAWLIETGTGFSSHFFSEDKSYRRLKAANRNSQHKDQSEKQETNDLQANGKSVSTTNADEKLEIFFPVPAGISRVRGGFEKQISAARQQAKGFQLLSSTSQLPFDVDEVARDFPTIQTPLMTTPSAELVLNEIVRTIKDQGILFVAIMFTDVRDTIFLGEFLKSHCPHVQLVISEPDILLSHPEYTDSLRGAIVASSYPMFLSGREACQGNTKTQVMPLMTGQAVSATYNAVLIQRALDRGLLKNVGTKLSFTNLQEKKEAAQDGFNLVGLLNVKGTATPRTWLHVIGYDRFFPLKIVMPADNTDEKNHAERESHYSISLKMDDDKTVGTFRLRANGVAWSPLVFCSILTMLLLCLYSISRVPGLGGIWTIFEKCGRNELLRPLFQYSSRFVPLRINLLAVIILTIALVDCHFLWLGWLLYWNECPSTKLSWITETFIFSGVSLLLPLFLSGSSIVFMCYMKLRQSYLVSSKRLRGIKGSNRVKKLGSLWWGGFHVDDPAFFAWLVVLGTAAIVWCSSMSWFATFNTSQKTCLFRTAWCGIAFGYAFWWISALELYVLQRQLRDYAATASKSPNQSVWNYEFEKLHQGGLTGVYRLLFGAGPGNHDPVAASLTNNAGCKPACDGLYFFRNIQYRMVIIKNQFYLLLGGAILLFMSVVSYPFTSGGMLNILSMGTIMTLVASACLCFWKLDTDRELSKILGTKPDEIQWNWGTISFFGRNFLLVALVLVVQFVPGTWLWLGKVLAPFSHFSH